MNTVVDLREKLPPVRDQGQRPTCLAFAASCGHAFANDLKEWLSPEYLYYYSRKSVPHIIEGGLTFEATADALRLQGQTLEELCPYRTKPVEKLVPIEPIFKRASTIHSESSFKDVWEEIKKENVFVLGSGITKSFFQPRNGRYIENQNEEVQGGHAVLAVGATQEEDQRFLLIMNSWGEDWADGGYAYMSESFFNNYVYQILELKEAV